MSRIVKLGLIFLGTIGVAVAGSVTAPPADTASTISWAWRDTMPTGRHSPFVAAVGDNMYVAGGETGTCTWTNAFEVYNQTTDDFQTVGNPFPHFRGNGGAATVNGKLYFVGGANSCGGGLISVDTELVEEYDPVTNTWTEKDPMPTRRRGLGVVAVGSKIYAFGGTGGPVSSDELATAEVYDAAADTGPGVYDWRTLTPMPSVAGFARAAAVGTTIYVLRDGGQFFAFDTISETWATPDPAANPWPRGGFTMVSLSGKIYVIGGASGSPLDDVLEYDPGTNSWAQFTRPAATPWFTARHALGSAVVNGKAYAAGGDQAFAPPYSSLNEEMTVTPVVVDADGDGVPDGQDLCPGTAAGVPVDADGCADAQVDGDADSVCNSGAPSAGPSGCAGIDACPLTPSAFVVDPRGCSPTEVDQDLDGVCDPGEISLTLCVGQDACPETALSLRVDSSGCSAPQLLLITRAGIDAARVTPTSVYVDSAIAGLDIAIGDLQQSPPSVAAALGAMRFSIVNIDRSAARGHLLGSDARELDDEIVGVARLLAEWAIDDAGDVQVLVATGEALVARGDAFRNSGRYREALDAYRLAVAAVSFTGCIRTTANDPPFCAVAPIGGTGGVASSLGTVLHNRAAVSSTTGAMQLWQETLAPGAGWAAADGVAGHWVQYRSAVSGRHRIDVTFEVNGAIGVFAPSVLGCGGAASGATLSAYITHSASGLVEQETIDLGSLSAGQAATAECEFQILEGAATEVMREALKSHPLLQALIGASSIESAFGSVERFVGQRQVVCVEADLVGGTAYEVGGYLRTYTVAKAAGLSIGQAIAVFEPMTEPVLWGALPVPETIHVTEPTRIVDISASPSGTGCSP